MWLATIFCLTLQITTELAFIINSVRGKPLIVYNKYTFCKHSTRGGVVRWTCSTHSYKCCKAVVKTRGTAIVEVKGWHNHDASNLLINRKAFGGMPRCNLFDQTKDYMLGGFQKLSCPICSDVANGMHYGVATCESCKSFFRRTLQANKHETYICRYKRKKKPCEISVETRSFCKFCRYNKCIEAGMQPDCMVPRYSWSRAGNAIIILGEYRFKKRSKHINQKQETHWVCNKCDKGCKAKLTTLNDAIIKMYNVHKHDGSRKLK